MPKNLKFRCIGQNRSSGDLPPKNVGGATRKVLNDRLKEMESQGLVRRKVINERPIAVTYELTKFGRSALAVLDELRAWAEEHSI